MNLFIYTDYSLKYAGDFKKIIHLNTFWLPNLYFSEHELINIDKRDHVKNKKKLNKEILYNYSNLVKFLAKYFNKKNTKSHPVKYYEIILNHPAIMLSTIYFHVLDDIQYISNYISRKQTKTKILFSVIDFPKIISNNDLYSFLSTRIGSQFIFQYIIENDPKFKFIRNQVIYSTEKNKIYNKNKNQFNLRETIKFLFYSTLNFNFLKKEKIIIGYKKSKFKVLLFNLFSKKLFFKSTIDDKVLKFFVKDKTPYNFDIDKEKLPKNFINLLNLLFPNIYKISPKYYQKIFRLTNLPNGIKKIYSSDVYNSYLFNLYIAENHIRGSELYYIQHGGGYKIHKFFFAEYIERKLSDNFISAGLSKGTNSNFKENVLNFNFYRKLSKRSYKANNKIITIQLIDNSYSEYFPSSDISSKNMFLYISDILNFLNMIENSNDSKNIFKIQLYPHKLSFNYENYFRQNYKRTKTWAFGKRTNRILERSKLFILTYFSTGILELSYANFPFILVLNKKIDYSEEAELIIHKMKECNLIFYEYSRVLEFIKNTNISNWFYDSKTQNTLKLFVKKYVYISNQNEIKF